MIKDDNACKSSPHKSIIPVSVLNSGMISPGQSAAAALVEPDYSIIGNWPGEFVLAQTGPRDMQFAIESIEDTGAAVWCPRVRVTQYFHSGRRERLKAFFPGNYFFIAVPYPEMFPDRLSEWHISSVTRHPDELSQTRLRRELSALQLVIGLDQNAAIHPGLKRGVAVEIVRGHFMGIRGVVESLKTRNLVCLNITWMEQNVPLELDAANVEPIEMN